ncbi:HD domain-containing protein [Algihabitans albus]|uniref:HD domain-containing protein n=1 Tax=Algihabitans albus TaxID=2164067 RepID=UPI000E5CF3EB|nr:HD domain-containing protein [Algihabitans albus]
MQSVSFTRMEDGTVEDYALLAREEERLKTATFADNVLNLLKTLEGPKLGYKIDRYQHSLQTATRAERDGAEEEVVVAALLHDIGDTLAPDNHAEFAATLLKPYVTQRTWWIVQYHGIFQGYYFWHHLGGDRDAREQHRGHPHFEACADFCAKWDQTAFDPDYDTAALHHFEPMVRRLLDREPWKLWKDTAAA